MSAPEDPRSSIEGLRAWLAQLDRSLGVRTYVLGAFAVLSLAASVVAIVLVLQLKGDAATEDDLSTLSEQVSGVQETAAEAARDEVRSLDRRLSKLRGEVDSLSTQQADLASQVEALQGTTGAAGTGATGTTGPTGSTGGKVFGGGRRVPGGSAPSTVEPGATEPDGAEPGGQGSGSSSSGGTSAGTG